MTAFRAVNDLKRKKKGGEKKEKKKQAVQRA